MKREGLSGQIVVPKSLGPASNSRTSCHFLWTIVVYAIQNWSQRQRALNVLKHCSRFYTLRKFVRWMRALTALWITCLSDTFGGIITIIIINNNINIKINILTLVLLFFTVIKAVYHYPSTSKPNQMPRDPAEVDMPAPQSTTMFWHLWSLIYLATPGVQNLIQTNYSPVPLGSWSWGTSKHRRGISSDLVFWGVCLDANKNNSSIDGCFCEAFHSLRANLRAENPRLYPPNATPPRNKAREIGLMMVNSPLMRPYFLQGVT